MKRFSNLTLKMLLVLIFISANNHLKGAHILGAEIFYKPAGGTDYKFILKVYRDCNECKFNGNGGGNSLKNCNEVPDLKIRGALNTSYAGTDFGEIQLTRSRISDITPACYGVTGMCGSGGSGIPYGYEVHVFEGTYNFSSLMMSGKCEFDVSISMSSRSSNINSMMAEQNFFNYTYLNLCNGSNESTQFALSPQFVYLQNQTLSQGLGIVNSDKDSLSFKLKSALVNRNQAVVYAMGRTYTQPFTPYCPNLPVCLPNPNATQAEGFFVSNTTGDVIFTPTMMNEGGVIVVECEEWKKNAQGVRYLAGVTRRDIYSEVISGINNLPRLKYNDLTMEICEGDPFSYQVNVEDLRTSSANPDSVNITMLTDLKDLVLQKYMLSTAPYNFYTLQLPSTLNLAGRYYITLTAKDNNCPLNGVTSKTIILNIKSKIQFAYNYKIINCGVLQVDSKIKNVPVKWVLYDLNMTEIRRQTGAGFTQQLTKGGKYILKSTIDATDNSCGVVKTDTINIPDFKKPEFEIGPDKLICKDARVTIAPEKLITNNSYKVLLNNQEVSFPFDFAATQTSRLAFRVMQTDGCYADDNININIRPDLPVKYNNDTICSNFTGWSDLDKNIVTDRSKVADISLICSDNAVVVRRDDALNWSLKIAAVKSTPVLVLATITDLNGCIVKGSFTVKMADLPSIAVQLPKAVCVNTRGFDLPVNKGGVWTSQNHPSAIANNYFTITKQMSGKIELLYTETGRCSNSKAFEVELKDTTPIVLITGDNKYLCENSDPLLLQASPSGGVWQGSFVNQNIFYPSAARNTSNTLFYKYSNQAGCVSMSTMKISVAALPTLAVSSTSSEICVGDELKVSAETDNPSLNGYWFSTGQGRFDKPDKLQATYYPSTDDIDKGPIKVTFTLQTNSVCGNVSEELEITVKSGPVGNIIKNYSGSQCEPAEMNIGTNYKNIDKQLWYINDSLVETYIYANNLQAQLHSGIYIIRTEVFNSQCRAVAVSDTIEVYPRPVTRFAANPQTRISREYPRIYLKETTKNKYPYSTQWYYNNQPIDTEKEIYYNVESESDTFFIKLVNYSSVGGCADSATKMFIFNPINQLYIPTAFTPDAKGPDENNEFKVKGPAMSSYYIEIFNKWGERVYYSRDINGAWDGNSGGKPCILGVYYYKINSTDLNGVSRDYSGTITLIR